MSNSKEEKEEKSSMINDLSALFPKAPEIVNWDDTSGHDRFPDVYQIKRAGKIKNWTQEKHQVTFHCDNGVALKVQFLSDHIFRIRFAPDGDFEFDHSYAIDPEFKATDSYLMLEELTNKVRLVGHQHHVIVNKSNAGISIEDVKGNILCPEQVYEIRTTILEGIYAC